MLKGLLMTASAHAIHIVVSGSGMELPSIFIASLCVFGSLVVGGKPIRARNSVWCSHLTGGDVGWSGTFGVGLGSS